MKFVYSINCIKCTREVNDHFDSENWQLTMQVPASIGMTIRYMNGMVFTVVSLEYSQLEDSAVLTLERS